MAFSTLTLVVSTGAGSSTNASVTLATADFADAVAAVQNGIKSGGFWIANAAAGVTFNQFIPSTSIVAITVS